MVYLIMTQTELLREPIDLLNFSRTFVKQCYLMGFKNLEAILCCPPAELVGQPGFNYSWLAELTDFLIQQGLLHLLQSIPGKSYD
jgi:hypothetical protein